MSGRVVHFEIPFDEKERATAFYQQVFGWRLDEMPDFDYVAVSTGPVAQDGGPAEPGYIGGGMTARGGTNTGPVITIDTEDVDAALAKVREHGGEVLAEKAAVGDMGFTGYFKDSEGNVVGLWQTA